MWHFIKKYILQPLFLISFGGMAYFNFEILFKYTYLKPSSLFSSTLVNEVVAKLSYEDIVEKTGSQYQLIEINKQIDEKSDVIFQSYIKQVLSFTPSYSFDPNNSDVDLDLLMKEHIGGAKCILEKHSWKKSAKEMLKLIGS